MRARRTHAPQGTDYDGYDPPPPEAFDLPPEPPVDEAPVEAATPSGRSLAAPARVCLACGDDPSVGGGCPHDEVLTAHALTGPMAHSIEALRAHHEAVRDELRSLRRLAATGLAAGDATIEVREVPVVAPRVVLIPPAAPKRARRAPPAVVEQGRFGFIEPAAVAAPEAAVWADQPAATCSSVEPTSPVITSP